MAEDGGDARSPLPPKIFCAMSRAWSLLFGSALGRGRARRAWARPSCPSALRSPRCLAGASPVLLLLASCSRKRVLLRVRRLDDQLGDARRCCPRARRRTRLPRRPGSSRPITNSPAKKNTSRKMLSAVKSSRSVRGTKTRLGTGWKQRSTRPRRRGRPRRSRPARGRSRRRRPRGAPCPLDRLHQGDDAPLPLQLAGHLPVKRRVKPPAPSAVTTAKDGAPSAGRPR